jgi:hypothetical protein
MDVGVWLHITTVELDGVRLPPGGAQLTPQVFFDRRDRIAVGPPGVSRCDEGRLEMGEFDGGLRPTVGPIGEIVDELFGALFELPTPPVDPLGKDRAESGASRPFSSWRTQESVPASWRCERRLRDSFWAARRILDGVHRGPPRPAGHAPR